jgi:Xaa-Pro dipeptidase
MNGGIALEKRVTDPEIPYDEFQGRIEKTKKMMAENGLDGLLLFNPKDVFYYSGFRRTWTIEWAQCCVMNNKGEVAVIVPQILQEYACTSTWLEKELIIGYGGSKYWGLMGDPISAIVSTIKKLGLENKTIGVETGSPTIPMMLAFDDYINITNQLPKATFKSAIKMIWAQRMIKTPWEQDIMRKVVSITIKGWKKAIESAHAGMTEREILKICWQTFIEEGAFDTPMQGDVMFRGGATPFNMATPRPVNRPLSKGTQMFFDGGAALNGYCCDCQRQFSVGKPSDLQNRLVELSEMGMQAAESAIKPGNRICDIHKAAMKVIGEVPKDLKDLGVDFVYSHTFMGHSEGLHIHEWPWITGDEEQVIQPGMVLAVEIPALDIPQFRVLGGFPEDIYLITENGYEQLTAGLERKQYIVD